MTQNRRWTKAEAYDILSGSIVKALVKAINEDSGSEFDRGRFEVLKNICLNIKDLEDHIIKEVKP